MVLDGWLIVIRGRPIVAVTIFALALGCADATLDGGPGEDSASALSDGKADNLDANCTLVRDGSEHREYCRALATDACNADPECYYQHSIPLYGGSFCAPKGSDYCEIEPCDPGVAFDAACLAGQPEPDPEPEPEQPELVCEFERGTQAHIDYCDTLEGVAGCDADPACYFQHSIPLYGGSFCAARDEHGPMIVHNAACLDGPLPVPAPQQPGDVVITEIMRDPEVAAERDGEWFEIYNPTDVVWNLSGCELHDFGTNRHTIGDLRISPESFVVLATSADPGFEPDYVYSGFQLANGAEDEIVITCDGVEIAEVSYDTTWDWTPGHSLELNVDSFDEELNDDATQWCPSTISYNGDFGTPRRTDGC